MLVVPTATVSKEHGTEREKHAPHNGNEFAGQHERLPQIEILFLRAPITSPHGWGAANALNYVSLGSKTICYAPTTCLFGSP